MTAVVIAESGSGQEVHVEGCRAALRRTKHDYWPRELRSTTSEAIVSSYLEYVDDPAFKVCTCARKLFSEHYLHNRKLELAQELGHEYDPSTVEYLTW